MIKSAKTLNQRSFASDNNSSTIPEALEALKEVSRNHVAAYGNDPVTEEAKRLFQDHFGESADVFFTFNGTAANTLCLKSLLRSYEAVICAETSHLHNDECGAPENLIGTKLLAVPASDGKLTPTSIHSQLVRRGDPHHVQPRVVSITLPTELGTLYTTSELSDISKFCKKNGLYFHIDGSRLPLAAAAMNKSFKEITRDVGCDALSFGGTKNGLMLAEACVFFDRSISKRVPFYQKQLLQLPGKSRYIAAQFIAFLSNDTWKKYAAHTLNMANKLHEAVRDIAEIEITQSPMANSIFAVVPKNALTLMREKHFFYVWDERKTEVRWMTNFDTTVDDINSFVSEIKKSISLQSDDRNH